MDLSRVNPPPFLFKKNCKNDPTDQTIHKKQYKLLFTKRQHKKYKFFTRCSPVNRLYWNHHT